MWNARKFISPVLGRLIDNINIPACSAANVRLIRKKTLIQVLWNQPLRMKHTMKSVSFLHSSNKIPGEMMLSCRHFSQRKNKRTKECEFMGCSKGANYGYPGEPPLTCFKHRKEGMLDVRNQRCNEPECLTRPSFGYEGEAALYCGKHKKELLKGHGNE